MTLKIHANGRLLRKILLGAILIFCAAMENETRVGAQEIPPSATPAELAAAIARTMNATKPNRGPNSPIAQEFGAHDNVVEIRTILRDAQGFATLAAHREDQRMGTTNYFCKGERRAYIKKGVVLHETVTGPNVGESFEYVIDERTCASLAKPVPTNAATLKKMTEDLAKRLATALPAEETIVGVQFQNEKPVVR
ncbi:MAG TPA: hypothetical protein VMJ31_11745, partial [Methylocystis sp.]|nr:hypothetical protein [Methylocystis sp.]